MWPRRSSERRGVSLSADLETTCGPDVSWWRRKRSMGKVWIRDISSVTSWKRHGTCDHGIKSGTKFYFARHMDWGWWDNMMRLLSHANKSYIYYANDWIWLHKSDKWVTVVIIHVSGSLPTCYKVNDSSGQSQKARKNSREHVTMLITTLW